MLSPNSTLCQNRYLILRNLWSDSSHSIYDARDTHTDLNVVIAEIDDTDLGPNDDRHFPIEIEAKQELFDQLKLLTHPSVTGIRDYFFEDGRSYLISRPVNGTCFSQLVHSPESIFSPSEIENGLRQLTSALSLVASSGLTTHLGITPANIRATPENEFKLLYFGSNCQNDRNGLKKNGMPRADFAFQPLEKIWDGLDRASQTTIANTYDDGSLDVLESPPEFTADMYSLGAIFYLLMTGKMPFDALERSIEILDGKPDPLVPPHVPSPDITPELSEYVMKLMRIRREDRFESFERALIHLNAIVPERHEPSVSSVGFIDEADVLELPEYSRRPEPAVGQVFAAVNTPSYDHVNVAQPAPEPREVFERPANGTLSAAPVDQFLMERVFATETLLPISTEDDEHDEERSTEQPSKFWFFSPVPAVVIVAVLVGAAIVAYLSFGSSGEGNGRTGSESLSTAVAEQPVRKEPTTVPISSQASAEPLTYQATSDLASEPVKEHPVVTGPANPVPAKNRPQIADTRPLNKPDGNPADPVKVKKKVTVDDLINDN